MFLPITNNVFARPLRWRCLALIAQIFTDICENLFALLTTYICTCASDGKWGWLWSKWGLVIVLHRYISASNYQRPAGQCDAISNWSTCNLFVVILSIWSCWHHWVTVPSFIRSHQTLFFGILSAGVRQPLINWWAISNSEQFVWQIIVTIYFCIYLFTELLYAALK